MTLSGGLAEQPTHLYAEVWNALPQLAEWRWRVILQWAPSHVVLPCNERADVLAKEASVLTQDEVALDTRTVFRAAAMVGRAHVTSQRPPGWYRTQMEDRWHPSVLKVNE